MVNKMPIFIQINIEYESHLDIKNKEKRKILAKFRISNHSLK